MKPARILAVAIVSVAALGMSIKSHHPAAAGPFVACLTTVPSPAIATLAPAVHHSLADYQIDFTEYNPGGTARQECFATMRAMECDGDGSNLREIAPSLAAPSRWTVAYGFTPSGDPLLAAYGDPAANAAAEDHDRTLHENAWSGDAYAATPTGVLDLTANLPGRYHYSPSYDAHGDLLCSAVVVNHLFEISGVAPGWKNEAKIRTYRIGPDGTVSRSDRNTYAAYGMAVSPDGRHTAYHADYVLTVDGERINTGQRFNFTWPGAWSPDSRTLLFFGGRNNRNVSLYTYSAGRVRLLAANVRNNVPIMTDTAADYHDGSSNTPCWRHDGKGAYVPIGREMYDIQTDGQRFLLTDAPIVASADWWAFPSISPDGKVLVALVCIHGHRDLLALYHGDWHMVSHAQTTIWPHVR